MSATTTTRLHIDGITFDVTTSLRHHMRNLRGAYRSARRHNMSRGDAKAYAVGFVATICGDTTVREVTA